MHASAGVPDVARSAAGDTPSERRAALFGALEDLPGLIVAYSGGVDSAYLAWAATQVLGSRAFCITADSPSYPAHHRELATRIARDFGLHHQIIRTDEMARAEYR